MYDEEKKAIYFAINTSVLHYITVFVENLGSGVLGAPVLFATEFTMSCLKNILTKTFMTSISKQRYIIHSNNEII